MTKKRNLAILGATGSIGTQTLAVVDEHPDDWNVTLLTANNNTNLLIKQAKKYSPNTVIIANEQNYTVVKDALKKTSIQVQAGQQAIVDAIAQETIDIVVAAMVGYSGLASTLKAIEHGKSVALANKETLVVAGDLITQKLKEVPEAKILPVDSEHSAIFQCLSGEKLSSIDKIWLTASGGPFLGKTKDFLSTVTPKQALKHPNWDMGAKITIDSATLMNKGFEAIEAKWLFDLKPQQIDVIVHAQSIIHSLVQFNDGSIKAQCGLPDMKLPIQYALYYPRRKKNDWERFDFADYATLNFETPDKETFTNLSLAYEAMGKEGNMPCILNAANEVVVQAFLDERIGFLEMSELIAKAMQKLTYKAHPTYQDYIETDMETREYVCSLIR
ncbi:1-deoxy-D-xylulose 5-phosphate reductoisomerase [Balneicella halophila]|uniref:1-deoxy-D-xylulose 5-phosphate reductoisomerase n=1 Tax=Balneicella halophila TaxID=1537566 RepID=A0A7L4UQR2_BALHA|nr:1-deoxy-D-xylulose-5-phosphate reductoisomerase [Balneicella halophila]PVX50080.1 1-deoxy-D-xylulose 5-phosphate reductoisomerase [Balneicella halophila]